MTKVVMIDFPHGTSYYAFLTDLELNIGDSVVCDTSRGLSVGKVVRHQDKNQITASDKRKAVKWVIQKVDLTAHNQRMHRVARIETLNNALQRKLRDFNAKQALSIMIENDVEAAHIYEELRALETAKFMPFQDS